MSTTEPQQAEQAVPELDAVPPVGEEIHLPSGSILPLGVAIGITLMVIGTTVWWVWAVIGFVLFSVCVGLWVRDVRRDHDALPEEHHGH